MSILPIDPLVVEKITGDIGNSNSMKYHVVLQNTSMTGFKNSQIINSNLNSNNWECYMELSVPNVLQFSEYEAKGKVLLFEFDSKGTLNFNYSELTTFCNTILLSCNFR